MAEKSSKTVWQARMKRPPSALHVAYTAGWDVCQRPMADAVLIPYDLWLNQAHALMLYRSGIIERNIHRKIQQALTAIEREWRAGTWTLDPALEDVHVCIERSVTEKAGAEAGGRLHTGRSRNDQSTTDVRMFIREAVLTFQGELIALVLELLAQAKQHLRTLMPGLSHTQPAGTSTFGHILCAHAQALLRDIEQMCATFRTVNVSPLGAAAGHGTSWPINRALTARYLGFDGVQENSIDCVSSRWEMEARATADLAFAANHLALLAQDLVFWSMPWIGFITLDDRHVTGSSIMPQKRNPDFCEVTRAKAAVLQGILQSLFAINKGMLSGYNRDSQWTKYLVMNAVEEMRDAPAVFREAIAAMTVDTRRMAEATQHDFLAAVDLADLLARRGGLPFRQAYEIVATLVRECESAGRFTPEAVAHALDAAGVSQKIPKSLWMAAIEPSRALGTKRAFGGPAPVSVRGEIGRLERRARGMQAWNAARLRHLAEARKSLATAIRKAR